MSSEWMKVMLEEISRKKAEAEQAGLEEQRRNDETGALTGDRKNVPGGLGGELSDAPSGAPAGGPRDAPSGGFAEG